MENPSWMQNRFWISALQILKSPINYSECVSRISGEDFEFLDSISLNYSSIEKAPVSCNWTQNYQIRQKIFIYKFVRDEKNKITNKLFCLCFFFLSFQYHSGRADQKPQSKIQIKRILYFFSSFAIKIMKFIDKIRIYCKQIANWLLQNWKGV